MRPQVSGDVFEDGPQDEALRTADGGMILRLGRTRFARAVMFTGSGAKIWSRALSKRD